MRINMCVCACKRGCSYNTPGATTRYVWGTYEASCRAMRHRVPTRGCCRATASRRPAAAAPVAAPLQVDAWPAAAARRARARTRHRVEPPQGGRQRACFACRARPGVAAPSPEESTCRCSVL